MYVITFVPGAILAGILYNNFSCKLVLSFAVCMQTLGAWLNIFSRVHLAFIYIGTTFSGLAYPLIIIACPLVAVKWFEDSKRVLVTTIFVSIGHWWFNKAFYAADIIAKFQNEEHSDASKLIITFSIKAAFSLIIMILTLATFESEPSNPPSKSADMSRDDDLLGTLKDLVMNK